MLEIDSDRLESWKEIAVFVGRTERTAMRWAEEGMPVGKVRGRVVASRAEITRWLSSHPEQECTETETTPPSQVMESPREKVAWGWTAAVVAALVLAVVLVSLSRNLLRPKTPAKVSFTENGFDVLDVSGNKLWAHAFPKRFDPTIVDFTMPLQGLARIDDFRSDGQREVLVVAPLRYGPNPDDSFEVDVELFSNEGKLLWSYVPSEKFQFGDHELTGPWCIRDVFISPEGFKKTIWITAEHFTWGNSFVAQLDATTGRETVRFVNTGVIYKLNELKTARGSFLVAGGFNNEYDSGSLALIDETRPFAASPQTKGTRHECKSCADGLPDYYFVFPRSEINQFEKVYEDAVHQIRINGNEMELAKFETRVISSISTIYLLRTAPAIGPLSMRYDSGYDMLHREFSAEKKLNHSLENCPERLHPKSVRMWTPTAGWVDLPIKAAKASD